MEGLALIPCRRAYKIRLPGHAAYRELQYLLKIIILAIFHFIWSFKGIKIVQSE